MTVLHTSGSIDVASDRRCTRAVLAAIHFIRGPTVLGAKNIDPKPSRKRKVTFQVAPIAPWRVNSS